MKLDVYRATERRVHPRPTTSYAYGFRPIEAAHVLHGAQEVGRREASGEDAYGSLRLPPGSKTEVDHDGQTVLLVPQGGPGTGFLKYTAQEAVHAALRGGSGIAIEDGFDDVVAKAKELADSGHPMPEMTAARAVGGADALPVERPKPLSIEYPVGDFPELTPPGTDDAERDRIGTNLAGVAREFIRRRWPDAEAVVSYRPSDAGAAKRTGKVEEREEGALGGMTEQDVLDEVDRFVHARKYAPDVRQKTFDPARFVAMHHQVPSGPEAKREYKPEGQPGAMDYRNTARYTLREVDESPDERVKFLALDDQNAVRAALDSDGEEVQNVPMSLSDYRLGKSLGQYDPGDEDALEDLIGGGDDEKPEADAAEGKEKKAPRRRGKKT